jgi:type 1 glutamine amidotransferase
MTMLGGMSAQAAPGNVPVPTEEELRKVEAALPAEAPAQAQKPRKILVFWRTEGYFHQCIPLGNQALKMLGEKTGAYSVEISDDMAMFEPGNLERFDAVLLNSTTRLQPNEQQLAGLLDFVRQGKGIIGIHAATDNFYCCDDASDMMGGLFDGHPWGAGGTWAIKVDEPDHPLNHGFSSPTFQIKDELYQIKGNYSRANQRVLLSLDMDAEQNHKVAPGSIRRQDQDFGITWIKPFGKGRVFYCSLGHNKHVFWNAEVLRHYLAGIQYALGDFSVDDAPRGP